MSRMGLLEKMSLGSDRLLVLVFGVVLVSVISLVLSPVNLSVTPDSAEHAMRAVDMIEQGKMFPPSWHDSTYAHFQALVVWAAHLCFDDYTVAERTAAALNVVFTALAFLLFARFAAGSLKGALLLPIMFFTLWSDVHFMYFCSSCYYSQFVVGMLLMVGVFFRMLEEDDSGNVVAVRSRWPLILLAVTFAVNVAFGLRVGLQVTLPMAGAVFVLLKHRRRLAWGILVAGVFGGLVYGKLVAPLFGVETRYSSFMSVFALDGHAVLDNLGHFVWGLFKRLGFPGGKPLSSFGGAVGIVRFAVMVVLAFVLPIRAAREFRTLPFREKFLLLVGGASFGLTFGVLVFGTLVPNDGDDSCARYTALPLLFLGFFSCLYAWRKWTASQVRSHAMAVGAILIFSLLCNAAQAANLLRIHRPELDRIEGMFALLDREQLSYGYALYHDSSQYTFNSNGRIAIRPVFVEKDCIIPQHWLSSDAWYDPSARGGPTFLALTDRELQRFAPDGLERTSLGRPARMLRYRCFNVLVYDFNVASKFQGIRQQRGTGK